MPPLAERTAAPQQRTEFAEGLKKRNIPISVVVYPWPAQVLHDTAESRQVRIWRDWCEGKCRRFISLFPALLVMKDPLSIRCLPPAPEIAECKIPKAAPTSIGACFLLLDARRLYLIEHGDLG